jgi:hypothetical protein
MRWKPLVLLAVAVALVLFIALFERKLPTTDERREASQKVFDLQDTDITGLELADGALQWALRKEDGKWRLKAPLDYPAEETAVSGILSALVTLRKERTLDPGADLKGFGLDPAAATLKMGTAGGPVTLALGAEVPGADQVAVRWAERGEAYFVGKNLLASLRRPVDELRDKAVFTVDASSVARMEVVYPATGRRTALWKDAGGWMLDSPFTDRADPEGVDKLLFNFTGLRAKAFVDEAEARGLKVLGLDPPAAVITFTDRDQKPVLEASVGYAFGMGTNEFYLRRGGQVFLVDADLWPNLQKGLLTIPNPKLFGFSRWEVDRLEMSAGGKKTDLERTDEGWKAGGKALASTTPVDDLLNVLTELKWMENYKTPALGEELLSAVITTEKAKVEATFTADAGDPRAVWAVVSHRPNYWKLEKRFLDTLTAKLAEIK